MDGGVVVISAALGLVVGWFLTRVIDRVPDREALGGPSRCPECRADLAVADTIPIVSWFVLGGRCRACDEPIAVSTPVVEAGTAVLFAVAALRFGASWVLVPFLVLFASLVAVTVIDLACYRIPDRIVFPTLGLALPLIVVVSLVVGIPEAIGPALVGSVVYFGLLFVPHLVYPKGMGFGDVKLALVLGLFLGWLGPSWLFAVQLVLLALVAGCVLGVVMGMGVLVVRGRRGAFPFGPALALGTVVVVLFSNPILAAYGAG
ncbi:A24 family peptidase [soil metagenome]